MTSDEIRMKIQTIATNLQSTAQQRATYAGQLKEVTRTIELLSTQEDDRAVYRQSGQILLEVEDREKLAEELESTRDLLDKTLQQLSAQETSLKQSYEELVTQFEG